ncbi:MAG: 4-hydroxy-tetrahydrodipicolinate synthase [Leptotrichiaceae bacterium]|mgnify:FL=1|nr:4-hydroxy-tetrahydrodipicolinate synthase [Leptotrichiaceae bacterium]MBP6280787.1 4-hydroxy-tetrahydrodipicolinate synthase [Leptotrichiaceae bacterium]MBP7099983.1 4-hydroxy-tetrahydrodipicolinate synthase [Leptotrichiaceae bacterium]MBP7725071.1 4-hydroxy-tetrahydrodipicolinate synthase [Leptotrichiaceae bacterium]MBP9629456.1 4-hydroxy-tetrahydrodipicolinate synthase [Leptotrichiaceae bacterium]
MKFKGSYVALITPFKENGELDEYKIRELVNYHIENGTSGIVPCGTTGEAPTLTFSEHEKVIKIVVEEVKGRIQVIAGAGSNNTNRAIELTKYAKELGADAALSTCPYYNKPSQRGLYEHYKKIAEEAKFPIMLYNVPSRTGVNIESETVAKLAEIPEIVAIKEATGSLEQMIKIQDLCGDKIEILSGEDHLILPMLSIGAKGVVSVVANIMPKEMSDLIASFLNKDFDKAYKLHTDLYDVSRNMFIEGNPVTVKTAMKILGKVNNDDVRLPLLPSEENTYKKLEKLFKEKGII